MSTTSSGVLSPPLAAPSGPNYSNFYSAPTPANSGLSTPAAFQQQQQPKSTGYQPSGPNYYTSVPAPAASSAATTPGASTAFSGLSSGPGKPAARTGGAGGDAFASLLAGPKKSASAGNKGLTIADMAKQKTQAGLYGAPAASGSAAPAKPSTGSSGLDDLLG
jgi:epsin